MKTNVNIGLEGEFHIKIYSGKTLMDEVGPVKNFITPTGLTYPQIYPFVDCFRFLSLGSDGNTSNQGGCFTGNGLPHTSQPGTTGLSTGISTYQTAQGTTESAQYIGWPGYANGSDNSESACGTLLTEQGPRFYRAWNIPTGGVNYTMGANGGAGLVINEFMVSPSSGSDPTGRYAFSRVRRTVTIPVGYSAIISYQLSINLGNTGLTYFGPNTFSTGSADVTSNAVDDLQLISGWANLSGYYRHVYHGLNTINQLGAHDTPQYGVGMEPSLTDLSQYCFYLSPDNSNFDISTTGAPATNEASAYAADGLMGSVYGITMTPPITNPTLNDSVFYGPTPSPSASSDWATIPSNIRIGTNTYFNIPSVTNYTSGVGADYVGYQVFNDASQSDISYATPGGQLTKSNEVDYKQKAIFSTRIFKLPIDTGNAQNSISGRTKTVTRKTLFSPVSSLGWNTRFGSLVFATNYTASETPGSRTYSPFVDTLFFDTRGRSLMQHYRYVNVILDNRGTGVADAYISITPIGENINVFANAKTFQGEYDPSNVSGFNFSHPSFIAGNNIVLSGYVDPNNITGLATYSDYNCSGYGMVYGILTGENVAQIISNGNYDCGLVDHNVTGNAGGNGVLSLTLTPTSTGAIYWPNKNTQLHLSITEVKYYSTDGCFNSVPEPAISGYGASAPYYSGTNVGLYNWRTNPCHFCPPTGHIVHYENYETTGYRLLPNFAAPNNQGNNYYSVTQGGSLPGTSFNNGIELMFSINWSSPCSDSQNCL